MALGSQLNAQLDAGPTIAILGELSASVSAAGTSQGTATLLTTANNVVTTVGAGSGVRLPVTPTVSKNDRLHVANHGANTLAVYPPVGGKFGTASTNVPAMIAPGKCADFFCIDGTNYTVLLSA